MKNINVNFILNVDSYKHSHNMMMKDGVVALESNIIARKPSKYSTHVVMMGTQIFVQDQKIHLRLKNANQYWKL